eukprot:COSAG04_NODE_529_length_13029_cov_3.203248_4_plen_67_part_00
MWTMVGSAGAACASVWRAADSSCAFRERWSAIMAGDAAGCGCGCAEVCAEVWNAAAVEPAPVLDSG